MHGLTTVIFLANCSLVFLASDVTKVGKFLHSQGESNQRPSAPVGPLRVTIGHSKVFIGHHIITLGHLKVTIGYLRASEGYLWVTI